MCGQQPCVLGGSAEVFNSYGHIINPELVGKIRYMALIFLGVIAYDVYFVYASDVKMTVAGGVNLSRL